MDAEFSTPDRKNRECVFKIPPSPCLKTLGFGTGVRVYELTRSPLANQSRSPWAIKKIIKQKLNEELEERLNWEAEILRKLNHPNIVGFRAHIKSQSGDILAMEECTTSLGDLIEEKRDRDDITAYPVNTILKVGHDISCALNYLHNEALILHCDIKSFNVLVKQDFQINKLCDFGISLPLDKCGKVDMNKVDEEFEYVGTSAWLAPEINQFPQIVTTKADIYAFGLVLQEMLTLMLPIHNLDNTQKSSISECYLDYDVPVIDHQEYAIILEIRDKCINFSLEDRPNAQELEKMFDDNRKHWKN